MMVNWPFSNHLTGRNSAPWWTLTALHKQSDSEILQNPKYSANSQSPDICLFKKCFCPGVGVLGGQLYAAGGHDGPLVRKSVEVYDPQTNTWRLVCDMNMCRRNAGQSAVTRPQHLSIYLSYALAKAL